jgi:hypothetical protein
MTTKSTIFPPDDRFISENEAADRPVVLTEPAFAKKIGLSLFTVRRMRKRGEIEYIRLSAHRIGYKESYAERLLAQRTVKPTTAA